MTGASIRPAERRMSIKLYRSLASSMSSSLRWLFVLENTMHFVSFFFELVGLSVPISFEAVEVEDGRR